MKFYVYVLFRPNGVPCYIGKGSGDRWRQHERKTGNPHLANIIAKAGCELPKVKIREGLAEMEAFDIERALIKAIGRKVTGGPLVNMTDGGDGVLNLSAESRSKISRSTAARMQNPDARAAIGEKNKVRQAAPAVRKVLSERMKQLRSDPIIGPKLAAPHQGMTHSPETRALIGQKAKERMRDPDRRASISSSLKGQVQSIKTRNKRGTSLKKYWDRLRQSGSKMSRPAQDEQGRRLAIQASMLAHWARRKGEASL